jgi:hypothetical protein
MERNPGDAQQKTYYYLKLKKLEEELGLIKDNVSFQDTLDPAHTKAKFTSAAN